MRQTKRTREKQVIRTTQARACKAEGGSLRPRPSRPCQALQSNVDIIAPARLQGRSQQFLRPGPDDGREDSKEVRVNISAGAEPVSGRSVGTLRQCIGGWIYNPIAGVRREWAERVGSVTPTHPSTLAQTPLGLRGTLGRLREVVRARRRPAVVCTLGPASGQEKGGLEEVTEAVILLSNA